MRGVCMRGECASAVCVRLSDCRWHIWYKLRIYGYRPATYGTGLVPLWLQAVGGVCVRLSEGLARSGCVAPGVTLLCDAGCSSWGFDRLQAQRLQPHARGCNTMHA